MEIHKIVNLGELVMSMIVIMTKICDLLLDGYDSDDYDIGDGLLLKYLNHFHHILECHDDETQFDTIYDFLILNDRNQTTMVVISINANICNEIIVEESLKQKQETNTKHPKMS